MERVGKSEIGVHPELSKLLWKYIHKYRHPRDENETALLIGRGKPLRRAGIQHVIRYVKRVCGLEGVRVSPHTFRHTFAKLYLEQGGDLFKLSRELGHSDVATTKIYLSDFGSSEARKDHTARSPLGVLNLKKTFKRKKKSE